MQPTSDLKRLHAILMVALSATVAALIAASMIAFALWDNHAPYGGMAMLLFNLDTEQNIPTWVSTVLLAYLAIGAWKLVPRKGSGITRLAYVALAAGFLFLSADEAALLHERVGGTIELDGSLSNARWIIIWLPVLGMCGLVMLAMLWKSSPKLTMGLAVGAVVYLTGAIGIETINQVNRHNEVVRLEQAGALSSEARSYSGVDPRFGKDTLTYVVGTAAEEGLEKSGILIWFAVILSAHRRAAPKPATGIRSSAVRPAAAVEPKPQAQPAEPAGV